MLREIYISNNKKLGATLWTFAWQCVDEVIPIFGPIFPRSRAAAKIIKISSKRTPRFPRPTITRWRRVRLDAPVTKPY
jgi:hypothetical protein